MLSDLVFFGGGNEKKGWREKECNKRNGNWDYAKHSQVVIDIICNGICNLICNSNSLWARQIYSNNECKFMKNDGIY